MIIKGYTVTRQVWVLAILCMLCVSCHDYETYAEQKEDEKILRMEKKVSGVMLDTELDRDDDEEQVTE